VMTASIGRPEGEASLRTLMSAGFFVVSDMGEAEKGRWKIENGYCRR
jgi:hypothetical protein